MNLIKLYFTVLMVLTFLLTGCGGTKTSGPKKTTSPHKTTTTPSAHTARVKGEVSGRAVDISVSLPSNINLLDYNGSATVKGKIKASDLPCLSSFQSFSCKAELSVGNININSCSIGKHSIGIQIVLFRGKQLKEGYTISGIIVNSPLSCHYQQ